MRCDAGLGLVIVLSVFFIIFSLRHPMGLKPESAPLTTQLLPPEPPPATLQQRSFDRKSFM
jgi:hypothetical protein